MRCHAHASGQPPVSTKKNRGLLLPTTKLTVCSQGAVQTCAIVHQRFLNPCGHRSLRWSANSNNHQWLCQKLGIEYMTTIAWFRRAFVVAFRLCVMQITNLICFVTGDRIADQSALRQIASWPTKEHRCYHITHEAIHETQPSSYSMDALARARCDPGINAAGCAATGSTRAGSTRSTPRVPTDRHPDGQPYVSHYCRQPAERVGLRRRLGSSVHQHVPDL